MIKRGLRSIALKLRRYLSEDAPVPPEVPVDNTYGWLNYIFSTVLRSDVKNRRKPQYLWGMAQAAALGHVLGYPSISVIEFGVAGGAGLLAMQRFADILEHRVGLTIDVHGFDTGQGLPKPSDYRDQPNMWLEGQLPMNVDRLSPLLHKAKLHLGDVKQTVTAFLTSKPAPVAFISFDLDLYTSTRNAMALIEADQALLLPRVVCYFDDILGHSYSNYTGERLAINEFNQTHTTRKLDPIHGLREYVSSHYRDEGWDEFYWLHIFDHTLYNRPDSFRKVVYVDEEERLLRLPIDSNWRSNIPLQ
jgi:hypothetical protein